MGRGRTPRVCLSNGDRCYIQLQQEKAVLQHRDFSEITLDPISLHAWLPLMESRLKKETLFLSLFDLWWCRSSTQFERASPWLGLELGIFLLKLFSQECICYTSMARKRSAFKEVSLFNMGLFCMVWVHHQDGFHSYESFPVFVCFFVRQIYLCHFSSDLNGKLPIIGNYI